MLDSGGLTPQTIADLGGKAVNPITAVGEALRRFDKDPATPSDARINAIKEFLIGEEHLAEEDLDPDVGHYSAGIDMLNFFEMTHAPYGRLAEAFAGAFHAARKDGGQSIFSILELGEERGGLVLATERRGRGAGLSGRSYEDLTIRERVLGQTSVEELRGWMIATPQNQMLIFLKNVLSFEIRCLLVISSEIHNPSTPAPTIVEEFLAFDYVPIEPLKPDKIGGRFRAILMMSWSSRMGWEYRRLSSAAGMAGTKPPFGAIAPEQDW